LSSSTPCLIVIGTSAGGVDALRELFRSLPSNLPAAICVVMHVSPLHASHLPEILNDVSLMPVHHARSNERLEPGNVYVAPPNRHLRVTDSKTLLTTGPRENRHRPAIDPLFRSAAHAYGARTIGVVLTGGLDDGTAGLWEIKNEGGVAVVQSPEDALHPSMPRNAIENVDVDYAVPIREMAELLTTLCISEVER
jgi:two-component system, chemotaxis family, protein-glutamate methylesterase/glutaminase